MFSWEIFFSVMLAILAAKIIGYVVQVATFGSAQNQLEQLNMKLGQLGPEVEQHIKNLGGGLGSKLESIDSILIHISDHTRDIKLSCEQSR